MGISDSKKKLGERVIAARRKLDEDMKLQSHRVEDLMAKSPETMKFILSSIEASFKNCAPFLEPTLLVAWKADKDKCREFVIEACNNVLRAPIKPEEYAWFQNYVIPSSIWMLQTSDDRFMYQELMDVAKSMSRGIIESMDSVFTHLQSHAKWDELMAIKEETLVSRQDEVGLLQDKGIMDVADMKDDDGDGKVGQLQTFIDSHAAINSLTVTAKAIDGEFQNYVGALTGRYGTFKAAPMKKVERCLSKLENDYQLAKYPKSAKLLDLVRCSVTFNTLEQLIEGFHALKTHVDSAQQTMKLARVKNGFLDATYDGGYRDIKLNVIFHSAVHPEIKMICEIQLILSQFLNEKKRIHKLYSIAREEMFFEMVVQDDKLVRDEQQPARKNMKELQFNPLLNVGKELSFRKYASNDTMCKCSVEPELQLLSLEGVGWGGVVDMQQKKPILEWDKSKECGKHMSHWISIDGEKHLSVQLTERQLSMFKVKAAKNGGHRMTENEKYKIMVGDEQTMLYCDFNHDSSRIVLVIKENKRHLLQVRAMRDVQKVDTNIVLDAKVNFMWERCLQCSADGRWCVLSCGWGAPSFYVIDLEQKIQRKLTSKVLSGTEAPCFINGRAQYVFVGDRNGRAEIWDVAKEQPFKTIELGTEWSRKSIASSASTHNILAIGTKQDKMLRLYDVRSWECFHEKKFNFQGDSIYLTNDLNYATFSGWGGDRCVVLKIE